MTDSNQSSIDLLFVQQHPPHGSIIGQEVLDACLMGSAFARSALVFLGSGVYQIKKNQDTSGLSLKDYSVSYGVLSDYDVDPIFCLQDDLTTYGLSVSDLVIDVTVITRREFQALIQRSRQVMTF